MTADLTDRIIAQGRALVRATESTGPFERALARLLMATYKRRLRGIVEIAPAWVSEEILSASEHLSTGLVESEGTDADRQVPPELPGPPVSDILIAQRRGEM